MAGRYREHDDGLPECRIDGQGTLPGIGAFSGPRELAARLIESQTLDACVVRQYLSFALGRSVGDAEARARAYRAVDLIEWPQGFCRRDIAWRAERRRQAGRARHRRWP